MDRLDNSAGVGQLWPSTCGLCIRVTVRPDRSWYRASGVLVPLGVLLQQAKPNPAVHKVCAPSIFFRSTQKNASICLLYVPITLPPRGSNDHQSLLTTQGTHSPRVLRYSLDFASEPPPPPPRQFRGTHASSGFPNSL